MGVAALALAAAVGAAAAGPLAPPPATRPLGQPAPGVADGPFDGAAVGRVVLDRDGTAHAACGRLDLALRTALTFDSVSPDGSWTLFAGPEWRTNRRIVAGAELAADEATVRFAPDRDGTTVIRAVSTADGDVITSWTTIDPPVWSHLNSFLEVAIAGHRDLALSIAGSAPIATVHAGYPFGAPSRQAAFDGAAVRVFESTNAEKGPFHELAAAPAARGDTVPIDVYDGDQPQCRLVLDDWTAQASIEPSPTAGWGFPENAIAFGRVTDDPSSTAFIDVTLAGTSVGRGFESVAHAPGTYRSRLEIIPLR